MGGKTRQVKWTEIKTTIKGQKKKIHSSGCDGLIPLPQIVHVCRRGRREVDRTLHQKEQNYVCYSEFHFSRLLRLELLLFR